MGTKTVTVTVPVRLTVDVDAWANEYGIAPTIAAVRDDVKTYVTNGVRDHLDSISPTLLAD